MRRTVLLYILAAAVVAGNWLRLESPHRAGSGGQALWIALLALAPALVRPLWARVGAGVLAALLAVHSAFGLSVFDARPFDGRHDFFGPLLGRFRDGFLEFYDVRLPIDVATHPRMHAVILAAVFGFCLALGLAVATRRAVAAVLLLVVGAGWPATLLAGGSGLTRGAVVLGTALALFAGLAARGLDGLGRAAAAGLAVVLCAVAASSSPAVAKSELLNWQGWDFYTKPQKPVTVSYVWRSSYFGVHFPKKVTTVLSIKAGPASLYWRAATLDDFNGYGWVERVPQAPAPWSRSIPPPDPLLPPPARRGEHVVKEEVTVEALRDRHLVGASLPIGFTYDPHSLGQVRIGRDGVALAPQYLVRGQSYTAYSYAPEPTAIELSRSPADYPSELANQGYLDVEPGITAPPLGVPGREARMHQLFAENRLDRLLQPYVGLYATARKVVGHSTTPYQAAIALETWLRRDGGFAYDEHPGLPGDAPLAKFVLDTKRGYCQHYAGAMALMLRFLGIPARVAAGFTSGTYDAAHETWKVTDHDAHTWVEVWFAGYGWLPFDPTPGRGTLTPGYTASSSKFDFRTARRLLALAAAAATPSPYNFKQDTNFGDRGAGSPAAEASGALRRAGPLGGGGGSANHASLLRLLALVVAALAAAIVLVKLALRRTRYLTRDPRRLAAACRRELVEFLADQGVLAPASATAGELARAVDEHLAVDARAFTAAVDAARFGPPEEAGAAARLARRELRRLERRLRDRLTRVERTRGLLSLRSLGFT
ncbi:MAG TPA: transglutaminaseTgpA domain-containing protein [Gaiellaceae bacterium]|nr:transglutaminaseTgpA domain-containing protein [Gaiellaceae bacterium]